MNIKLGSVASNIVGKSGRAMLDLLAAGSTDAERMADEAIGQLRNKMPELILALDGRTDAHFRWMLTQLLHKLDGLDAELAGLDRRIEADMEKEFPFGPTMRPIYRNEGGHRAGRRHRQRSTRLVDGGIACIGTWSK